VTHHDGQHQAKRHIALLGSTGSVGVNTLNVIRRHPNLYEVKFLTTYSKIDLLEEQIAEFAPKAVVVLDPEKAATLRARLKGRVEVLTGEAALSKVAASDEVDTIVGALVGFAGLRPTIEAIKRGKRICIANKETLVVAGELLQPLAKRTGAEIIPIDSEHSAIAQCLVGEEPESIKRIILTASGGPFRTREKSTFETITLSEALKHPNWIMGQKITIDSATLMNKGLEIIEAKWLFDLPLEKIDVIVHPQSIVHSMVEFVDGSIKAQLGAPDMRLPIQYALEAPHRLPEEYDVLDLLSTKPLEFYPPDVEKFPALRLAREASMHGGVFPCVLNAANEIAVDAFLKGRIGFTDISRLVEEALDSESTASGDPLDASTPESIEAGLARIFLTDARVRTEVLAKTSFRSEPVL
jgi:1-deoxy-D-xylulose-5-phosphate reductoisomerase